MTKIDSAAAEAGKDQLENPEKRRETSEDAERNFLNERGQMQNRKEEMTKEPTLDQYATHLSQKTERVDQLTEQLIKAYENNKGGADEHIKLLTLLEQARQQAHNPMSGPESPSRVRLQQEGLANAGPRWQAEQVRPRRLMSEAYAGNLKDLDTKIQASNQYVYRGIKDQGVTKELIAKGILNEGGSSTLGYYSEQAIKRINTQIDSLDESQRQEFSGKYAELAREAESLTKDVVSIAAGKILPPEQLVRRMEEYSHDYAAYDKKRQELGELASRIDGAISKEKKG